MGRMAQIWLLVMLVPLGVFFLPAVVVLVMGMLPTLVAVIIDRSATRHAGTTVGALNFAGTFPFIWDQVAMESTVYTGFDSATNAFHVFVMYGAAASGWMLYMAVPPVVVSMSEVFRRNHIRRLESRQSDLLEEWGQEIVDQSMAMVPEGGDDDDEGDRAPLG